MSGIDKTSDFFGHKPSVQVNCLGDPPPQTAPPTRVVAKPAAGATDPITPARELMVSRGCRGPGGISAVAASVLGLTSMTGPPVALAADTALMVGASGQAPGAVTR